VAGERELRDDHLDLESKLLAHAAQPPASPSSNGNASLVTRWEGAGSRGEWLGPTPNCPTDVTLAALLTSLAWTLLHWLLRRRLWAALLGSAWQLWSAPGISIFELIVADYLDGDLPDDTSNGSFRGGDDVSPAAQQLSPHVAVAAVSIVLFA